MARVSIAAGLFVAPTMIACGGRSTLLDAAASSDAGAPAPPAGAACSEVVLSGAPIGDTFSIFDLVPATEDGARVNVVFRDVTPDHPPPAEISSITLSPWGAWPPSAAPTFTVCPHCEGQDLLAAPALPAAQPGFSLLMRDFAKPGDWNSVEMVLFPAVAAETNYDPSPAEVSWPPPDWGPSQVALERGASGHLTALYYETYERLGLSYIDGATLGVQHVGDVACPGDTSRRGIAPVQGGFLFAALSRYPLGDCASGDALEQPAVEVMRIDEATKQHTITASLGTMAYPRYVALAKRAEGAWLVWQSTDPYYEEPYSIQAVPLSESGEVVGPIVQLTQDGDGVFAVDATAMGPRLVVAGFAGSNADLRLVVLDDDGVVKESTFDMSPWMGIQHAPHRLLASPDGTKLLFAGAQYVARFECAAGL